MPAFFFKIAIFCPNPTGYLSYRWRSPLLSPTTFFIFSKKKLKLDDWTFEEYKNYSNWIPRGLFKRKHFTQNQAFYFRKQSTDQKRTRHHFNMVQFRALQGNVTSLPKMMLGKSPCSGDNNYEKSTNYTITMYLIIEDAIMLCLWEPVLARE